jgi:hypothetical protein
MQTEEDYCITWEQAAYNLKIFQRFGKHCNCHLQGECLLDGEWWGKSVQLLQVIRTTVMVIDDDDIHNSAAVIMMGKW